MPPLILLEKFILDDDDADGDGADGGDDDGDDDGDVDGDVGSMFEAFHQQSEFGE